mmetsp:Transcript_2587/g.5291  ORF Transcript_2587/g.5291 Transcript_2587/m.5291 type:complete len:81 (+) Transcript_2587:1597-1839(+)
MAMDDADDGSAFEEAAMAGCRSGGGATTARAAVGRVGEEEAEEAPPTPTPTPRVLRGGVPEVGFELIVVVVLVVVAAVRE